MRGGAPARTETIAIERAESTLRNAAQRLRAELRAGQITTAGFRAALEKLPAHDRDAWLDFVWDSTEIPPDGRELPRGCVPYLPCTVATAMAAIQDAGVAEGDVFVDVGSGVGRVTLLAHLTTRASCFGLEIQAELVHAAQARANELQLSRLQFVPGDAAQTVRLLTHGTVFFLYCPFSGERLNRFLHGLEDIARTHPVRVCCVDMPALELPWLARLPSTSSEVHVYQSTHVPG